MINLPLKLLLRYILYLGVLPLSREEGENTCSVRLHLFRCRTTS